MTGLGRSRAGTLAAACLLVLAACSPTATTKPTVDPASAGIPVSFPVLGCLSIDVAECAFVAEQVHAAMRPERGAPFAVIVQLYGCANEAACPRTLAVREGKATVEWVDGGEPVEVSLAGPPQGPRIERRRNAWSGLLQPRSPRVVGPGPHPFELGHCGLTWQVDFDGSFWLPTGAIDGDAPAVINSERGTIVLLGPNLARFVGDSGFTAQLARFPGPKHVWLCG